jgi:hypothetical protein
MRSTRTIRLVYAIKTNRERVPARESLKEKLDRLANLAQGGTNGKFPGLFPFVAVYSVYSVILFTNFYLPSVFFSDVDCGLTSACPAGPAGWAGAEGEAAGASALADFVTGGFT